MIDFRITGKDRQSGARAGEISTGHGKIRTPVFMPVGTLGGVKLIHTKELREDIKARIILGNTYHLYLRPGTDIIEKAGGLHKFNGWSGPILTDSGGYQVYSLAHKRKLTNEGVVFQSHIDGSRHKFTPENVMDIQRSIGADIIMGLDECTPYPCDYDYAEKSMYLTHAWLDRCIKRFDETEDRHGYPQTLFPIVQGSIHKDLRKASAEKIASIAAGGNAIGGLSVGEPHEIMYEMTALVCNILPQDKPRYLMGVGTPENILESISLGVDMFDCVMPTRNARHGLIYTSEGVINIKNEKWKDDFSPLDEKGDSFADTQYSKAYVRHLFVAGEQLGAMITSLHNLRFYIKLVETAREKIIEGNFTEWKNGMLKKLGNRL
ncbi:MAG: tRNA guanosine(34) transglycosylase Tgt [Bacteroidales bacterium]|nr:tRNA guanosine(34) transglycosylase Tgt [Bacteroidales bacterium]MCF8344003.1 tRNA guanosine(34) transglycosylase Tgt [Bacteroidales bacterium]MCF8349729.1 tRNA guanosine(34) transglycosylase Tgt [Bacteroidales bacterium]MCF8376670.1 tRNA guanosine(34) transglycosylase Tgt [Bacteroidales bacterium]